MAPNGDLEMADSAASSEPDTSPVSMAPQVTTCLSNSLNIARLAHSIVRDDAKVFFFENYESILQFWVSLLREITLPSNITSTDKAVLSAFQAIDRIILTKKDTVALVSRLAYVLLPELLLNLKSIVAIDRENGRIKRQTGYRDACVVLDLYSNAQQDTSGSTAIRSQLYKRILQVNRWVALGGIFPILLLAHSEEADRLMWVTSENMINDLLCTSTTKRIPIDIFRAIAKEAVKIYPVEVVRAAAILTGMGQTVVRSGTAYNIYELQQSMKVLMPW
jgi:hypothetical protein